MRTNTTKIWALLTLFAWLTISLCACGKDSFTESIGNIIDEIMPDDDTYSAKYLEKPEIIGYDIETSTLSWKKVDNAFGYTIDYNGSEFEVAADKTQEIIPLIAEENVFKIKALGDDEDYLDSEWSAEYKYTVEKQEELSIYNRVNIALGGYAKDKDMELIEVLGISFANMEGNKYEKKLVFECLCKKNGVIKLYSLAVIDEGEESISDILANITADRITQIDLDKLINFDAANYFIESGAFDGNMQQLKNDGYRISVVTSCVTEGSKVGKNILRYDIVATYKAERGDGTVYFTARHQIDMTEPSGEVEYDYGIFILEPKWRTVKELSFVLHEGPTWQYMCDFIQNAQAEN